MNGNIGQLFGIGVWIDRAIAIDNSLIGQQHKEHRRYQLGIGSGFDQLQGGANGIGRGVDGPGDQAVDIIQRQHHGTQNDRVFQLGFGHWRAQALVFAQLNHGVNILGYGDGRIDDLDGVGQDDIEGLRDTSNLIGIAQQDAMGNALFVANGRGSNRARFTAFR